MNTYIKKRILTGCFIFLIVFPVFTFFKLQVLDYNKYKKLAGDNSLRSIEIKAPRGIIYDRNKIPIVDNLPTYYLKIVPIDIIDKNTGKIHENFNFKLLNDIIGLDKESILLKVNKYNKGLEKFRPFTIKKFIDFEKKSIIEEHILELPGIVFSEIPARAYVSNVNLSHALGYLRLVDRNRRKKLNHPDSLHKYSLGDVYGFSGLERSYEHLLRGRNGVEYRLVDNRGVDHGKFSQRDGIDVVNGPSLITSIDINLQLIAETLLKNKSGSIICMDPTNGEIIAFSSSPDYDLKPFVGPVPQKRWDEWNNNSNTPLLNRVISGTYPPGSVFKLVTSALLLNKKMENNQYQCDGDYELGSRIIKCWNPLGHGMLNLKNAIKHSCNVYFYKAIESIPYNDLIEMAFKFNFGNLVGIDLPNEKPGLVPTVEYMRRTYEYRDEDGKLVVDWARGGTKTLVSIGQGEVLVTPLQIINMINLIANNGYSFTPHLIKDKISSKKNINLPESLWSYLNHSMWKVINEEAGTGKNAYVKNAVVRGKTGTAQNPHGDDHSWFSGYIINQNLKKMSVVIIIENGGRGSGVASGIAKELFHHFSNNNK